MENNNNNNNNIDENLNTTDDVNITPGNIQESIPTEIPEAPQNFTQPPPLQDQNFTQPPPLQDQNFTQPPPLQDQNFTQPPPFPNQNFNLNNLPSSTPKFVSEFLKFDTMITPSIIKLLYYIGIAIIIISTIVIIITSFASIRYTGIGGLFAGIIGAPFFLVLSLLGLRVTCESIILQFEKHKLLKQIEENTRK